MYLLISNIPQCHFCVPPSVRNEVVYNKFTLPKEVSPSPSMADDSVPPIQCFGIAYLQQESLECYIFLVCTTPTS